MKDEIQNDIETIQSMLEYLNDESAIELILYTKDGGIIKHWWNDNNFIKSSLQSELRNLQLEFLNL